MTMAITKAAEEGAQAVICASTGNTTASAAAYAVRAGMVCAVLVPAGQDRARQDGQALVHGARLLAGRRQLRRLPHTSRASSPTTTRSPWSTRSTPSASRARRRRRSRSSTRSATPPTSTSCRSATPATSRRTGRATASTPPTASPAGRPGCGASRPPAPRRSSRRARRATRRPSPPRSASATPPPGSTPLEARDESGGLIDAVTDREILRAYRLLASQEGVFVEPASAASVAGLLQAPSGACSTRASRSCARSPATASRTPTGRSPAPRARPRVRRPARGRRQARPGRLRHSVRDRHVPRPAGARARPRHQRQPRPGLRRLRPGPRPLRRRRRPGRRLRGCRSTSRARAPTRSAATSATSSSARMRPAFDVLGGQPRGLALVLRQPHPARSRPRLLLGRDRRRARRRALAGRRRRRASPGRLAAGARRPRSRATPTTSRPPCSAASPSPGPGEAGARAVRLPVHPAVTPVVFVPATRLATETARGLLPADVPHVDAAANAGRAALLVAGADRDPALLLAATEDRLHQALRAPRRCRARRRCWSGCARPASRRRLRRRADGASRCCRPAG